MIRAIGLAFALLPALAFARDLGQWGNADAEIAAWFSSLRQPDNPQASCCGESDAYWADGSVTIDGKFFAIITDDRPDEPLRRPHIAPGTRIEVPAQKFMNRGTNPTGHTVIFVSPSGVVYCYVTGALG